MKQIKNNQRRGIYIADKQMKKIKILIEDWYAQHSTTELPTLKLAHLREALNIFIHDYLREYPRDMMIDTEKIELCPTIKAILCYRVARQHHISGSDDTALCLSLLGRYLSGIEIYFNSKIGNGFRICHGTGTVIGRNSIIGDNCTIYQGVTIGVKDGKTPILGDNVTVFPNSTIAGGIKIGNNSVVGLHTLCLKNVPPNSIAYGNPMNIKENRR